MHALITKAEIINTIVFIYLHTDLYNFYTFLLINALEKSHKEIHGPVTRQHLWRPVTAWGQSRSRSGSGSPPTPPGRRPACRRSAS